MVTLFQPQSLQVRPGVADFELDLLRWLCDSVGSQHGFCNQLQGDHFRAYRAPMAANSTMSHNTSPA